MRQVFQRLFFRFSSSHVNGLKSQLTLVLLHDQTTAVERFCLVSFADVDPPCAKHNLVTESVYHLPDTKLSDGQKSLRLLTSVLLSSLLLCSPVRIHHKGRVVSGSSHTGLSPPV